MIPFEWLEQAKVRIDAHIRRTPLTYDARRRVFIKWENQQVTGSFKARGAFNKVLLLEPWEREVGIVVASAGNHGQGVALAGQSSGAHVEVFVGENASPLKVAAMRALGAEVHVVPGGYAEAESAGRAYALAQQKTWISPYNDGQVIAGQGTIGLEVVEDLRSRSAQEEPPACWLVPVGGGGLIAGIGAALTGFNLQPRPRLIGVQAQASPFMYHLFYHGSQEGVPDLPTLADGLTGAVEDGSLTIPLVRAFVDEIILVSEDEIARAIAFAWSEFGEKIEGSGAVTLAALLSGKVVERPAVAIVSGGNIQPEVHARIVERRGGEG
ncbi:MAG: threonine ammonia-lyase [Anaerolineae bacterium]